MDFSLLTALPLRVAQFQVSAGASRVLLGAVGAAQVLNLVVEGLECGIDLHVLLSQGAGGLISSHVPERIGGLLSLAQTGEGRHVDARAGRTRRTRGSGITRRTLKEGKRRKWVNQVYRGKNEKKTQKNVCVGYGLCSILLHTAGPDSPERPRGPGGPMGPGVPFDPSLPAGPFGPGGPYRNSEY